MKQDDNMEYAIALDVGGSKMTTCLVDETGKIIDGERRLTDAPEGRRKVLLNIISEIKKMMDKHKDISVKGIGIGMPGFIDSKGKVVFMPNVPLVGFNIVNKLNKRFKCPVAVENDANCFALGEYSFGRHKSKVLLGLIVGTGVGCGIVSNGKLISGCGGGAGEIGHNLLDNSTDKLVVKKNDFESVCSGPNISRRYSEAGGKDTIPKQVFAAKDHAARKVIDDEYNCLGKLLGSMVNTLNPDTIVLGGSVSKSLKPGRLRKEIVKYSIPFSAKLVKVKQSRLDDIAGVLGAAALIFEQ
jgi:glucokinase